MLLMRMSSSPNNTVGRRIAYEMPVALSAASSCALPRKYSSGDVSEGFVMLTWTTRETPAAFAA